MTLTLEEVIQQKERALEEYLATSPDPTIRQLLADITVLRRIKDETATAEPAPQVVATSRVAVPAAGNNGGPKTIGDATVEIMNKAGGPLHTKVILSELASYGFTTSRDSLASNLRKDPRRRFVGTGDGTYWLSESAREASSEVKNSKQSSGGSQLVRMGFSLIGAVKDLIARLHGEFSQPVIFDMLVKKHPLAAPHIQKASVATTLRKLAEDGLIEVTFKGFGSEPRRYRRATQKTDQKVA